MVKTFLCERGRGGGKGHKKEWDLEIDHGIEIVSSENHVENKNKTLQKIRKQWKHRQHRRNLNFTGWEFSIDSLSWVYHKPLKCDQVFSWNGNTNEFILHISSNFSLNEYSSNSIKYTFQKMSKKMWKFFHDNELGFFETAIDILQWVNWNTIVYNILKRQFMNFSKQNPYVRIINLNKIKSKQYLNHDDILHFISTQKSNFCNIHFQTNYLNNEIVLFVKNASGVHENKSVVELNRVSSTIYNFIGKSILNAKKTILW